MWLGGFGVVWRWVDVGAVVLLLEWMLLPEEMKMTMWWSKPMMSEWPWRPTSMMLG